MFAADREAIQKPQGWIFWFLSLHMSSSYCRRRHRTWHMSGFSRSHTFTEPHSSGFHSHTLLAYLFWYVPFPSGTLTWCLFCFCLCPHWVWSFQRAEIMTSWWNTGIRDGPLGSSLGFTTPCLFWPQPVTEPLWTEGFPIFCESK